MKIIWTNPAVTDLDNLKNYISQDSPRYASIFINKLIEATTKLVEYPTIGRIVPERNNKNIREVIFQHYRIIYKIQTKEIYILTVCHGGRNLKGWKEK